MSSTSPEPRRRVFALAATALLLGALPAGAAPSSAATSAAPSEHRVAAEAPASTSGDGHDTHEDVGLQLAASPEGDDPAGATCTPGAPVREEHVVALDVDITLNRFGDHDPQGRMFAREADVARVRDEEARNAAARTGTSAPAVTAGLQGDAIQPLVLRAVPGDCLRIVLRNGLTDGDPASLHVHGAGVQVPGHGPASVTNPAAIAAPGSSVTYEWQIPGDQPEGTHYVHSGGNERAQVDHGLFGALIIEPPSSTWADPRTGAPAAGWDAVVQPGKGRAFREFTLIYHEVGDETYQLLDRNGSYVPLVDTLTQAYRPGGRAIDYRSEPFSDRLALGASVNGGTVDESLAYSSYAYGDPATPVMRAYLGDPVRQRVLHGGDEVFHVHHLHGGSVRWARQPGTEPGLADDGLDKSPKLVPDASERTDSQTLGPSESFDVADECTAGGCQQGAGDFLFHCHIASHYFAGMWGLQRVYNTLQDGPASTDGLPPFAALPDRSGSVVAAVPTSALSPELAAGVEAQLPPPGVPKGYDASVWDWQRDGGRILGEPETDSTWADYQPAAPGRRPDVLVDPRDGRLAYPTFKPHLAKRPPFAPNHGPAPFLDPTPGGADPPAPGASGPASLCPAGAHLQHFDVNAIRQPVPLNQSQGLVDSQGQLFVLRQQEDAVRADPSLQVPLAIRANAGEDCVDILLRNEIGDDADKPFSKVSLHIHFVQFDPQAGDGLDAGFNYEQTIRPFRATGTAVAVPSDAGGTAITVGDASSFSPGAVVGVGLDQDTGFETRKIAAIDGTTLRFDRPLDHAHGVGEVVSTEFVRYRWWVDAQFGTSYFHDHVDAIHAWTHGLVGALIAEPPGSTYTDPRSGAPVRSGAIADIHTNARVSADVTGSFRELALFVEDDLHLDAVGRSTGGGYGLRAEPLAGRGDDHTHLFSSARGDPVTPLLEANLGDPVVVRSLAAGTNEVHTVHLDGHWFRGEPYLAGSPMVDTVQVGISERFDLVVPAAGGPQRMPGDYLYYSGRPSKLAEGSWGIVRVDGPGEGSLRPLPGHEQVPRAADSVCPPGAPNRTFAVSTVEAPLPMLDGAKGKIYVLDSHADAVTAGREAPEPLVLHAAVGDCISVRLTNRTTSGPTTYTCFLPAAPGATGVGAGKETPTLVAPGQTGSFTYYASPQVGETVAMVRDFGDVLVNPELGLYGAIVVGPAGTTYRGEGAQVDAYPPHGAPYRDVTLFFQDEDQALGTHRMPYSKAAGGASAINYRSAPVEERSGASTTVADAYRLDLHGDPPTPLIRAFAGDPLQIHVLAPYSEQSQVFGLEGHDWPLDPAVTGSNLVGAEAISGLQAITVVPRGGAGGLATVPGDYLYGNDRGPYREAGMWGVLRVLPKGASAPGLAVLQAHARSRWPIFAALGLLGGLVVTAEARRRRARRSPP